MRYYPGMKLARLILVAAVAGATLPAIAQPPAPAPVSVTPPTPSKPDDQAPSVLSLLATLVIVGAVAAPALLNPKRGHQD